MENASKALLMAGGVLIGILMLSLAVYLFATFGAESKQIHEQIEIEQLTQYNAHYTIYEWRADITIYDIISVANFAKENNDYYKDYGDYESTYKVTVSFNAGENSVSSLQDASSEKKQELLDVYSKIITVDDIPPKKTKDLGKLKQKFACHSIEYHKNGGRVKSIGFKKVP